MTVASWPPKLAQALQADDRRIVVTGAGGWIGRAALDLLIELFGEAFDERVTCFGTSARDIVLRSGRLVAQRPLAELGSLPPRPTTCLHLAFLTRERAEEMDGAAYRAANMALREQVIAALDSIGVDRLFVASSGAAYQAADLAAPDALRLYGEMKLADETGFADWAERTGARAVICRIFTLSGPYINKVEHYALGSFICQAMSAGRITVNARVPVMRSYVAIRELLAVVFGALLDAKQPVTRFDSGGELVEIGALASRIGDAMRVPVDRPPLRDEPGSLYFGDIAWYNKLRDKLDIPPVPLDQQIAETADYLKEVQ